MDSARSRLALSLPRRADEDRARPLHRVDEAAVDESDVALLVRRLRAGDRRSLARAITLVESTRADHRREAQLLLERLLPHAGHSMRIGISGAPGVGKSTFIECFGLHLIAQGRKVAVLAVDPS